MKRVLLVLLLSFSFLITACSDTEKEPVEEVDSEVVEQEQNDVEEAYEELDTDKENGTLTQVGQKINDPQTGSTVELIAIKNVNETIDLSPIELTINDIKLIRMTDIKNNEFKSYMSQFTEKEEFNYIQVMYTLENTVDENVELVFPIEYLVLNTGEQIDVNMNDFLLDPNNGREFFGKVTKDTGISVIIENSNIDEVETIKFITGDVWQIDGDKLIGQVEKTYNIK
ncbi:hypothetical protein ACLIBH_12325 [Virgibacillus sp. W0430]|uniref:hypothetical protein n=1 Tax=Virgibacillus sp. W0430 TaxID=3391580 RepID=UPI003F478394